MPLSLDVVSLGVAEVADAREFHVAALAPSSVDRQWLDLHGAGRLALHPDPAPAAGARADAEPTWSFRGCVMTVVVAQPSGVRSVLDAAVEGGATVLKPARKSLFGAFSAVYRAPDGSVWKVAAPTGKDRGPATEPVVPTETVAILGVADVKAAGAFYAALGVKSDKAYRHYADFHPGPGACRLALMPRRTLAKDAGVDDGGTLVRGVVLHHGADTRGEVDATLSAACAAGGRISAPATETAEGYRGDFTDPDGFVWRVTAG
ncbi:VOC family protein [Streptomyces sp. NPDC049906]|uniref:VOC family protein n=1 Tax=Streptomyces sp. NPDC049906 TaxID=3155656 RepID=UPI0034277D00